MAEYKAELFKIGGGNETDSGWQTLSSSQIECTYRKVNNIVYIQCSARNVTIDNASVSLGSLPVGYRPTHRTAVRNGYVGNNDGYLEIIPSDGSAAFNFVSAGVGKYCHCNTAYVAD